MMAFKRSNRGHAEGASAVDDSSSSSSGDDDLEGSSSLSAFDGQPPQQQQQQQPDPSDGNTPSKKSGGGWFSAMRSGSGKGDASDRDESERVEDEGGSDAVGDASSDMHSNVPSRSSSKYAHHQVETIPDFETDYHEAIRDRDWDGLELLLKDYDFELYKKPPPKPKKKQTKKLRVAKYLPEMPTFRREKQVPISPFLGLDALGRTPLHLCCVLPVPSKFLIRILNSARDAAAVKDHTGSLPLHLAVQQERGIDVIDRLVRGFFPGSWMGDGRGRTPLMWAVEVARKKQEAENLKPTGTYWGFPASPEDVKWQERQTVLWELAHFLVKNRDARQKKLLSMEHGLIVIALREAAPPEVISLLISTGKDAFKKEELAGKSLSLLIRRQYSIDLLRQLLDSVPQGFAKLHKDITGRGVVAAHYRIGCTSLSHKRDSFRLTMQKLANARNDLQKDFTPPAQYLEWWEKLKLLINLWGTHIMDESQDKKDYFHEDELLLHNALTNPDVPPSLVQLLAVLYPDSPDLEHPKSKALPIHLACRIWRYRHYPPRRGEKEISLDRVSLQLIESDPSRTRKRYRDRLPLHHAISTGKNWDFIKPLVTHDRKSLQIRDPDTKLYPFEMAAMKTEGLIDLEVLTRQSFAPAVWTKMRDYEQDHEMRKLQHHFDLQQLGLTFELLKHSPDAISRELLLRESAAKRASGVERRLVSDLCEASEEVVSTTQMKLVRAMFGLGNVSGHFIGWCYENTARGWKPHRRNFAVLKESIMDGFVPSAMDKWWKKLKFWLWQDCPWENIPHRDDFLLHGALCNPEVSPWIIELLLECFPRSATIPLPDSNGCYPLHIACVTNSYVPLSFEFPNNRNVIEMVAKVFHDSMLLKWNNQLPLHLAIARSKDWEEMKFMAENEPVSLAVPDSETNFFAFQFMAVHRPYTRIQRRRFEQIAMQEVGKEVWKKANPDEKVVYMSKVLEGHEAGVLGSIYELLRRNPILVSVGFMESGSGSTTFDTKGSEFEMESVEKPSSSLWLNNIESNLSIASLDFLEEVYEKDNLKKGSIAENQVTSSLAAESSSGLDSKLIPVNQTTHSQSTVKTPLVDIPSHRDLPFERHGEDDDLDGYVYAEYEAELEPDAGIDSQPGGKNSQLDGVNGTLELRDVEDDEGSWNEVITTEQHRFDRNAPVSSFSSRKPDTGLVVQYRHKDIILVTRSSAFLISHSSLTSEAIERLSKARRSKNSWQKALRSMGEKIDEGFAIGLRQRCEQVVVASISVEKSSLLIDEDDDYLWVLCGKAAVSFIEGYDFEVVSAITKVLRDSETDVWLDRLDQEAGTAATLHDDYDILSWILNSIKSRHPSGNKDTKIYNVTRTMLRQTFSQSRFQGNAQFYDMVVANGGRKLIFSVAQEKLETRFHKAKLICARYQIPRGSRYERNKYEFLQSQKKVKLLKNLRAKQKKAKRAAKSASKAARKKLGRRHDVEQTDHSCLNVGAQHLSTLNQPKVSYDDDSMSIDQGDLFNGPQYSPPAKPLLAAAIMAREQSKHEKSWTQGEHLKNLSQPKMASDDESIDTDNLFDPPIFAPAKPLLSAAIKAREESEQEKYSKEALHLSHLSQPKIKYDDDDRSLVDVFDPQQDLPAKPLLTAAIKAREQARQESYTREAKHLRLLNQPRRINDDEKSLDCDDLFDRHPRFEPAKPLLTAAINAREQLQQELYSKKAAHLNDINQPRETYEYDNRSIDIDELFDERRDDRPAQPFLAAAIRAREDAGHARFIAEAKHLKDVNQPKTIYEDDNRSINEDELFVYSADSRPAKPLVAAAIKARELSQQERYSKYGEHLQGLNQPNHLREEKSMDEEDLFNDSPGLPPAKPLLAAALLAKEKLKQDQYSIDAVHLRNLNQPISLSGEEKSIYGEDVFDDPAGPPPSKPLLKAAIMAREQSKQEQYSKGAVHLRNMNQPKSFYEEEKSIDEDDLFAEPQEPPSRKPLLDAAYKARELQRSRARQSRGNGTNTEHLRYLHQPQSDPDDDTVSLVLSTVFDPSMQRQQSPPQKPLLTAARKAKEQRDAEGNLRRSKKSPRTKEKRKIVAIPEHLRDLHQPPEIDPVEDECSLTMADVFDPPKPPPPAKPLLTAALKAKAGYTRSQTSRTTNSSGGDWRDENPLAARRPGDKAMSAGLVRKNSLDKVTMTKSSPTKKKKKKVTQVSDVESVTSSKQSENSPRKLKPENKKSGSRIFARLGGKKS